MTLFDCSDYRFYGYVAPAEITILFGTLPLFAASPIHSGNLIRII